MDKPKQSGDQAFAFFLLIWAIFTGGLVRILPVLGSEMPVNDGGLFYTMAQDVQATNYSLPEFTSFNQAEIPFAYPPFALYIAAFGDHLFPMLQIVRWLPPIISSLTVIAFFILGRAILKSDLQSAIATVAFAMLPAAYELTITGGGLTRSFGILFSIMTLYCAYRLFQTPHWRYFILTILMAIFLVLSHPVATIHTLLSVIVFWFFWGRSKKGTVAGVGVAILTLALTSPWWLTVISRHGIMPFLSAMRSGVDRLAFLMPLLRLDLGNELFLDLITIFGLLGLIITVTRRQFLLLAWILAIFVIGRDAQTFSAIPLAMAASVGITDVIFRGLHAWEQNNPNPTEVGFRQWFDSSRGAKLFLGFFLLYTVFNAFAFSFLDISVAVTDPEQDALRWVNENTAIDDRFLMLTFGDPLNTPFQEWFPAITNRVNLTVVQGYEWLPNQQFAQRLDDYNLLQPCLTESWDCVEEWVSERGYEYDYVYIYRGYVGRESIDETELLLAGWLLEDLKTNVGYKLVYETSLIQIFAAQAE